MHEFLLKLYYEKYNKRALITLQSQEWLAYKNICIQALEEEPPPTESAKGKVKKTKGRNLAERLLKYQREVLRFVMEENVPFSNDLAE